MIRRIIILLLISLPYSSTLTLLSEYTYINSFSTILAEVNNAGSSYNLGYEKYKINGFKLTLTGELFGFGNDLELGFDSIVLNLFDGTIDTLFRPNDWNYDDYDRNKSNNNYDYNKPHWVQSDRNYIPWTVYTDNNGIYYLLELDGITIESGFFLGMQWDYSSDIYFDDYYAFYYAQDGGSEIGGGEGLFDYNQIDIDGDINQDGEANILDIVISIDLILIHNYDILADLNQDGLINILDIVLLINLILNP